MGGERAKGFSLGEASTRWWVVLLVLGAVSVWLYAGPGAGPAVTTIEGPTMGTRYRVVVSGPVEDMSALRRRVEGNLNLINDLMSTYKSDSELSGFNQLKTDEPFGISAETHEVLEIARQVGAASDGAFDVTVGPLVNLWGFGPDGKPSKTPSDGEIDAVRAAVGPDAVELGKRTLRKKNPATQVDLSAVAKGFAVDLIAESLAAEGYAAFLVEVGGEVVVKGEKSPGRPFRVGIEEPDPTTQRVHTVLTIRDGALATSGNYRNYYDRDGVRYAHTIDPKTGRPVAHRLLSASVYHSSCAWADAWATALMAAGDKAWALARRNNLEVLLLFAGKDGTVEEKITDTVASLRVTAPTRAEK
ncbi:MAG: FAD:protein FMN transferase [Myxococcota bacterium]